MPGMRSPTPSRLVSGELLMTLVAILWGSAFPVTRVLLEDLPPLGAAAWRTLLAAGALQCSRSREVTWGR